MKETEVLSKDVRQGNTVAISDHRGDCIKHEVDKLEFDFQRSNR